MAVAFAHVSKNFKDVQSAAQSVQGVTMKNVTQAEAGDWWESKRKIAVFYGDSDLIDAAYEEIRRTGHYVNEFQRHLSGWPDKIPRPRRATEDRTMKDLLQDLEEAKGGDVDMIEARVGKVYPERYDVCRNRWTLIER